MHTLKTKLLNGPHAESIDKLGNFMRYLARRFIDDRCFEAAGSLSYTSILAIVPFAAVVFAVFTAFPVFDQWSAKLTDFVFANFVPDVANNLENTVSGFANSARTLPFTGIVALLISVGLTMWSVEKAFNSIWRVPSPKPKFFRFLIYWGMLTLGSLLIVALLALNSALSVYVNFANYTPSALNGLGLFLSPLFWWLQTKLLYHFFQMPFPWWVYILTIVPTGLLAWHIYKLGIKIKDYFIFKQNDTQYGLSIQRQGLVNEIEDILR